jgi:hypothetical protein
MIAKVVMWGSLILGGATCLLVLLAGGATLLTGNPSRPAVRADCALQADRLQFIEKLKRLGVVYKLEQPASLPHVYVTPRFMALGIDEKRSLMGAISAYSLCVGAGDLLRLRDSRSGTDLGTFSAEWGLALK